jgi:ribosomal protein S18 acetylase RimI-like enzyme
MSPPTIRAATPADHEILATFNTRLAWESEGLRLDPETIRRGVAAVLAGRAESRYLVAELDGHVVGQLLLTREWSDWRDGWFHWIQSVYVAEPVRRRGIFRSLLTAAQADVLADPTAVGLRLYVEEHNATAIATYERLGFQAGGYRVLEWGARRSLTADQLPEV